MLTTLLVGWFILSSAASSMIVAACMLAGRREREIEEMFFPVGETPNTDSREIAPAPEFAA